MNGSVPALLALLYLAAVSQPASALECYACRMKQNISGINLPPHLLKELKSFPTCDIMEEEGPSDKFEQMCSAKLKDSRCANIVDPSDATNRVRTCIGKVTNSPELPYCHKTACYCGEDLCNASGVMSGSEAMITAVLAMLRLAGW